MRPPADKTLPKLAALVLAAALALPAAALAASPAQGAVPAAPANVAFNPQDKESARQAYLAYYKPALSITPGWTGNTTNCVPGAPSQAFKDAMFNVLNYARAYNGLPRVVPASTPHAQAAALVFAANPTVGLSHRRDQATYPNCWTPEGSGTANGGIPAADETGRPRATPTGEVIGGMDTAASIMSMISDLLNLGVIPLGHRTALFSPSVQSMSLGAASNAYVAHLFGNANPSGGQVAWPPAGFVPFELMWGLPGGASGFKWDVWNLAGKDLTGGTVTVTKNGQPVQVANVDVWATGAEFDVPDSVVSAPPASMGAVDVYHVKIAAPGGTHEYDVKVFMADEASDPDPVPKVLRVASAAHSPTGSVVAGTVLTATYGAVTDQAGKPVADAVIGYEWVRKKNAFTETAGTARTYTTKAGDAGWELWVRVCASKSGYQPGCVDSPGSVKVTAPPVPQVPAFTPTVSGTVKVDATLTVAGVPSGYTAAYQWLRDGAVIGGATGSSYKVGSADVGKRLSVKVTLSKAGYTSRTATSGQVGPVPTPLAPPAARVAMFSLGQDMTGNGYGETLTVWTDGTVRRHGASKGTPVGAAQVLATGWQGSRVYGPGDLTGDKRGDLLRITPQGDLFLYPGDGKGGIGAAVKVGWGWQGYRLMPCGDLDRDGKPDLLGVDEATGKLWFYPGTGNGRFGAKRNIGWGWKGFDLYAAGDVTGDGKPDILSVKRTAKGELYVYPGTGKGQFAAKKQAGWGWSGFKLASGADLNGDGRADLLGVNNQTGQVWFYPGNGKAGFGKTSLNLRW